MEECYVKWFCSFHVYCCKLLAKLKPASFVEKARLFKSSWLVAMATQVLEAE